MGKYGGQKQIRPTLLLKQIKQILMSATNAEPPNLGLDQLQSQLRQAISGKKYLLVLDDTWNEDREKWLKLSSLLKIGKQGSKILVTTRSTRVAKVMGTIPPHHLGGLSDEMSWALFQKVAFESEQEHNNRHFVDIGKEIVKRCGNVPLAIRTLGSLLYGQPESKWLSVKNSKSVATVSQNDIMPILKLSYNHLTSPLKNCFAYCALFSKDYEFNKKTLISLWMAEGYVISPDGSQRQLEDVGEDYFLSLVQRCFFQDVKTNEWGDIESCKIHDLLHDLAQDVAKEEVGVANFGDTKLEKRIRHLSLGYCLSSTQKLPHCVFELKLLRTFLMPQQVTDWSTFSKSMCDQLISSFRCLRVLDLNNLGVKTLPRSIGNLIHLRYLNLSHTKIATLPSSITYLHNLQILNLSSCRNLRILPKDIRNLINLRSLDVGACGGLAYMPKGMGALTCLHKLNVFIVNGAYASSSSSRIGQLRDLKNLNSLKGSLKIKFHGEVKDSLLEAKEANLNSKFGLNKLMLMKGDYYDDCYDRVIKHDEDALEGLRPPHNLKKLEIHNWGGEKLPSWIVMDNLSICLPNLVEITLSYLGWRQVPSLGHLKFLRCLYLRVLLRVEYINPCSLTKDLEQGPPPLFFPSLQVLELYAMRGLKGWERDGALNAEEEEEEEEVIVEEEEEALLTPWMWFRQLSSLTIWGCPNLKYIPMCPNVKELTLVEVDERVSKSVLKMASKRASSDNGGGSSSSSTSSNVQLKKLKIDKMQNLINLQKERLQHLTFLEIFQDQKLENTEKLDQLFKTSLPSLRQLKFNYCKNLKRGITELQHLTALDDLCFSACVNLEMTQEGEEEEGIIPWKALSTNLVSLKLSMLYKMERLPEGIKYLTNLRSLDLSMNNNLKEVPEWIGCLSSLQFLDISVCHGLTSLPEGLRRLTNLNTLDVSTCHGLRNRCRGPNGLDWPKIHHIPFLITKKPN